MLDICYIEEFFNSLPLKELIKCSSVCKKWHQYLNEHPEVFWFKHPIKFSHSSDIYPCSCIFNQLFWIMNGGVGSWGAVIYVDTHKKYRFTYEDDNKIELIRGYDIFYVDLPNYIIS